MIVSEPKTARSRRVVALDPETVEVLKAQAASQIADQEEWEGAWSDSGYVFTKEDGNPYHRRPTILLGTTRWPSTARPSWPTWSLPQAQ